VVREGGKNKARQGRMVREGGTGKERKMEDGKGGRYG
jgi:hypothetical protein